MKINRDNITVENLDEIVREINSYYGTFENLEVYENDEEFFDTFYDGNIMQVASAVQFGDYDINDEYVRINGYGNLETLDTYEYHQELEDERDYILDTLEELVEEGAMDLEDFSF